MEINKNKDFEIINKQNIDKRISGLLKNPKNESLMFKNRFKGFIFIGVFCILGIILLIVGAFFQDKDKINILISLDTIGVALILLGIFMSFMSPIKNFKILKNQFDTNFSDIKRIEIFELFFCQFETISFQKTNIENNYLLFKFNDVFETKFDDKKIFLYKNNQKIKELNKNIFNTNIKFKSNLTDSFKGSNIESFTNVVTLIIKAKVRTILNYLIQEVVNYEENN